MRPSPRSPYPTGRGGHLHTWQQSMKRHTNQNIAWNATSDPTTTLRGCRCMQQSTAWTRPSGRCHPQTHCDGMAVQGCADRPTDSTATNPPRPTHTHPPRTRPRPSEAAEACSSRPTAGGLIPAARRPSLRLPGRLSSRAAQRHIHIRSSSIHSFIHWSFPSTRPREGRGSADRHGVRSAPSR